MRIAVIPARGGSKRIPRKNVRSFCGKPIIAYSIEAALDSNTFDHVLVSTDDEQIASIARDFGAETPFIRPKNLSDDYTGTTAVIRHALEWSLDQEWEVDAVCGIYATTPFTQSSDILRGLQAINDAPAAYSVTSFPYTIFRSLTQHEDGTVSLLWPEYRQTRSQDLTETFHDCGQFYWGTKDFYLSGSDFMDGRSKGILIPRHRVQDIDTEGDWKRAELMYRALKETGEL